MTEQLKPHFRVIAGRPIEIKPPESRVDIARRKFGKPFAHEEGSTWKPRATRLLTSWMATRPMKEKA